MTPDHAIAALAGGQGGVASREQLVSLGLSSQAVDRRVRSGRLHTVHRGVYAVGHRVLGASGRWWAAILACGDGTVLSHASAAAAWDLRPSAAALTHVTVPARERIRHPGIAVHRPRRIDRDEMATCGGIPITSPGRTMLDLAAGGVRGRPLEAALDRAELLRILDFGDLGRLLERYPRRPGSRALRAVLAAYAVGSTVTRSELEERFLALCDRHRIPRPAVNTRIEGMEVDFLWPRSRLVVEVDGYAWHRSPTSFEVDRVRDVTLILAGYRVLRFTWEQVTRRPAYVAASLRRAMWGHLTSHIDVN